MKHKSVNMNSVNGKVLFCFATMALATAFTACDDDPKKENTPELITGVTLTFTPVGGGTTVTATATDPDGDGVADLEVEDEIDLSVDTEYTLSVELVNGLFDETEEGYDITAEVEEEADEHIFFYAWTNNVFSDPGGNGNVDTRSDDVNYNDVDDNGLPLGLNTSWTSAASTVTGTFRIMLKHQPDLKSASSTSGTGDTDLDLTFTINID